MSYILIKLTRLVETAPYDKFWTNEIWEILYKLHWDIILVLIKLTRLVETAPYDKDVNEVLIKLTRLVETAPYDKFWTNIIWEVLYLYW